MRASLHITVAHLITARAAAPPTHHGAARSRIMTRR
jgi:hypothetical protein